MDLQAGLTEGESNKGLLQVTMDYDLYGVEEWRASFFSDSPFHCSSLLHPSTLQA
jgi:hypothetical protein